MPRAPPTRRSSRTRWKGKGSWKGKLEREGREVGSGRIPERSPLVRRARESCERSLRSESRASSAPARNPVFPRVGWDSKCLFPVRFVPDPTRLRRIWELRSRGERSRCSAAQSTRGLYVRTCRELRQQGRAPGHAGKGRERKREVGKGRKGKEFEGFFNAPPSDLRSSGAREALRVSSFAIPVPRSDGDLTPLSPYAIVRVRFRPCRVRRDHPNLEVTASSAAPCSRSRSSFRASARRRVRAGSTSEELEPPAKARSRARRSRSSRTATGSAS